MKILALSISGATQIHTGKCYFIGMAADSGAQAYNIETSGSAGQANRVADGDLAEYVMLPKPGVECTNGLYVSKNAMVYWSMG